MSLFLIVSYGVLWLIVVVQGLALLEVLRQLSSIQNRISSDKPLIVPAGDRVGQLLPDLHGVHAANGADADWGSLLDSQLNAILFVTPKCRHCFELCSDLASHWERFSNQTRITIVVNSRRDEATRFVADASLPADRVVIDETGATAEEIPVRFFPGVVVTLGRMISYAAIVNTAEQLDQLVQIGTLTPDRLEHPDSKELEKHGAFR
jgi:hypothetical protein